MLHATIDSRLHRPNQKNNISNSPLEIKIKSIAFGPAIVKDQGKPHKVRCRNLPFCEMDTLGKIRWWDGKKKQYTMNHSSLPSMIPPSMDAVKKQTPLHATIIASFIV
jgi:hypothetical protein